MLSSNPEERSSLEMIINDTDLLIQNYENELNYDEKDYEDIEFQNSIDFLKTR